jgi:hypothetical protein
MVCQRMGLLDDAIREHLELKRLRGADPGEVAREQREALDPVPRRGEEPSGDEYSGAGDQLSSPDARPGVLSARDEDFSAVGEETAELDMRTVLDDASGMSGLHEASDPERVVAGSLEDDSTIDAAEPPAEESLEWEMPGSHEQRSETLDVAPATGTEPGETELAAEDVLEETPEFLRDTPEQERLWFEQRPPRDFDFDK